MTLTIFLSGCWDMHESERMYYTHGLGVDYQDGQFVVYFQLIDFAHVAKTEQAVPNTPQAEVGKATGKTIDEAILSLYNKTDESVYWGHLSYIVFSEAVLREGLMNSAVDTFNRYRDARYTAWMYTTNESIEDILLATPQLNKSINLTRLADPTSAYFQNSFIKPINFRLLLIGLNEPSYEIVIPKIAIKETWQNEQGKQKHLAISGAAVVGKHSYYGFDDTEKLLGLRWMTKDTVRGEVNINVPSDRGQSPLTVILYKPKIKVKPLVERTGVKFDVDIKMDGSVSGLIENAKKEDIRKATIEKVVEEISETYKEGLKQNVDIYRLSEVLYRKDVKAWKMLHQDGKVELTEESIRNITVEIPTLASGRKRFIDTID